MRCGLSSRGLVRGFLVLVGVLCWSIVALAQATNLLDIETQKKLFLGSVQSVLERPEFAPFAGRVRVLAVGSWFSGGATDLSDVDATLFCGDPALERRLVKAINGEVEARVRAKGPGLLHKIKLIVDRDPHFDELFPGETGQKFVFDYCMGKNRNSCLRFDGERLIQGPTEEFWTCRGGKFAVPHFIDRPQDFIGKCAELLAKSKDESKPLWSKLFDAAKYASNVDDWLQRRLLEQYKSAEGIALPEELKAQVRELLEMKRTLAAEQAAGKLGAADVLRRYEEGVARIFGSEDGARTFLDEIAGYLDDSRASAAILDDRLKGAGGLLEATGRWGFLKRALKKGWLVPLELYAIGERYVEEGLEGAAKETMFALLGHGCPATIIPRIVLEVAHVLGAEGVRLAGNYFAFSKIHAPVLERIFLERDESGSPNEINIFAWEQSKLRTVKRECLWYHWPRNTVEEVRGILDAFADWYVDHLAVWKGFSGVAVFASAGAGDIREAVRAQLYKDWEDSRTVAHKRRSWAIHLLPGVDQPAEAPFQVWLDGSGPGERASSSRATRPGTGAGFQVILRRELDELIAIYDQQDFLWHFWGKNGSLAAEELVARFTADHTAKNGRYRASLEDKLEVSVTARGADGWVLEGDFPWLPDLARGEVELRKTVPMRLESQNRLVIANHVIRCRPTASARSDLVLQVDLVYTRASHDKQGNWKSRRIPWHGELVARLEQPPQGPRRIRDDADVPRPVESVRTTSAPDAPRPSPEPPAVPAPRPSPPATDEFDEACALSKWTANFESKASYSGRDTTFRFSYRLAWTCRPFIRNGEVRGAFQKYVSRQYDDGRVVPPYVEVTVGDASQPAALLSVGELRRLYPECLRAGRPGTSTEQPPAPTSDAQALLSKWKRDFESEKTGRAPGHTYTSRVEWTCPPFIKDGVVYGAFKRMTAKAFDDGRKADFYPEVEMYDKDRPGILTTLDAIEKQR